MTRTPPGSRYASPGVVAEELELDRRSSERARLEDELDRLAHKRAIREVRLLGQPRRGPSTSEFWVTILVAAAGLYLVVRGDVTNGTTLLAAAGVGYPLARGLAKK